VDAKFQEFELCLLELSLAGNQHLVLAKDILEACINRAYGACNPDLNENESLTPKKLSFSVDGRKTNYV
jgi:hypothetical protein